MTKFWNFIKNEAQDGELSNIELRIEGDIIDDGDEWAYELFGEQATAPTAFKNELQQFKGQGISLWINSYGGSVFAAARVYNALKEHDGKIIAKIDAYAMSAASVIAMAADEIHMSPSAIMMIHDPLTSTYGNADDLKKTIDILDSVKESIINVYSVKTGRSHNKISQMMSDETWMSANVAVKEGFADKVLYTDAPIQDVSMSFNRMEVVNCNYNATMKEVNKLKEHEAIENKSVEELKNKLLLEIELI